MSLDPRFQVKPHVRPRRLYLTGGKSGPVRAGFMLNDTLTDSWQQFDRKYDAIAEGERILQREQAIDWDRIHSYDFHHDGTHRPCVEVYAYDEQGAHIPTNGRVALTLVGYDRDPAIVYANVQLWLGEMSRIGLPRKSELAAERRLLAEEAVFISARPGIRSRPSALAAERSQVARQDGSLTATA